MADAGYTTVDGSGPFPNKFDDCDHDGLQIEWPDFSVGLTTTDAWCDDCGATAVEVAWDPDPEGTGWYVETRHWLAPEYKEEVSA